MGNSKSAIFLLSLLISACSDDTPSTTEISDDNVFQGQVDALQKAKTVENTLNSSFEQRARAVDLPQ